MDQLLAIRVFLRIADAGSFAKAADSLNLPRSSVSKLLQDLEQHLGAKLVERNTRALTITPEGEAYRDQATALIANLDQMDATATGARASPRGKLRIDVGSLLANRVIIPALPGFHARYPEIELLLGVSDRPADIVGDGVDCVIRGGALADSSLIARHLGDLKYITCATPEYLEAHGRPSHPSELASTHVAISYFFPHTGKSLPMRFDNEDETLEISARSVVSVSESTAQVEAVLAGIGIGQIFEFSVRDYLESGRLVTIFDDWVQPSLPLHVVYPATRHPNAKTRAFADWAVSLFGDRLS